MPDIAPVGTPECSAVVCTSRMDGAGGDMKDGLFVTDGVDADDTSLEAEEGAVGAVPSRYGVRTDD